MTTPKIHSLWVYFQVMNKKAIFLMGPTASGKTALAMQWVQDYPVEIISVDSAMVYQGMDIGTGKPNAAELLLAPHHLIDIRDPSSPYSAAQFAVDALLKMYEITARGKIPLLVGGTMLYFRALLGGLSPLPPANAAMRSQIEAEAASTSWQTLHNKLSIVDPKAGARIHPNDPQRIQRALEVYRMTGKPISDFYGNKSLLEMDDNPEMTIDITTDITAIPQISDYQIHQFCLAPSDRSVLHDRIEKRFNQMLKHGLIEEARALYARTDLSQDLPAMRAVGYRQIMPYLAGDDSFEVMRYKGIVATRQLAKRQLTWLRNSPNIKHLSDNNRFDSLKSVIHCVA